MDSRKIAFLAAAAAPLFLTSCVGDFLQPKEDPTRYYVLSSASAPETVPGAENVMLNISQVRIPAYMSRQQIVSKAAGSPEVMISDFNRWPEYPVDSFTRVIATDISKMVRSQNVYAYPGMAPEKDAITLRVIIVECIGQVGGKLDFKARWELVKPSGAKTEAQTARLFVREIPSGAGYIGYAVAVERALNELSLDIAKGLVEFKKGLAEAEDGGAPSVPAK